MSSKQNGSKPGDDFATDMAELYALAGQVTATAGAIPEVSAKILNTSETQSVWHSLYLETVMLRFELFTRWPDPMGDKLKEWPQPIVCGQICP